MADQPIALPDLRDEAEKKKQDPPRPPRRRVFIIAGALALLLLAAGMFGHWTQGQRAEAMHRQMTEDVPEVQTQRARRDDSPIKIDLPGQTLAFDTATMYARATGYIAQRQVDIGSRVHKGDLLVRISAPDLDQQLEQARAQLLQMQASFQQAIAQRGLATVTNRRTSQLVGEGWASRQQGDQDRTTLNTQSAAVGVAQANVAAQQAQVNRLVQLTGFERIIAPFDGVVTVRNVDNGDLVTADQSGGTALFSLDRTDVMRVQVYVPQSEAIGLRDGLDADVSVSELDGRVFHGKVARSSVSLYQNARTLLAEVDVPNPDGTLRAGLYAEVTFHIPRERPGVVIPDEAMVFDQTGLHVLVVQQDGTAKPVPITIYRDFGTSAELRSGLTGNEDLLVNPPADIADGGKIKVRNNAQKTS